MLFSIIFLCLVFISNFPYRKLRMKIGGKRGWQWSWIWDFSISLTWKDNCLWCSRTIASNNFNDEFSYITDYKPEINGFTMQQQLKRRHTIKSREVSVAYIKWLCDTIYSRSIANVAQIYVVFECVRIIIQLILRRANKCNIGQTCWHTYQKCIFFLK